MAQYENLPVFKAALDMTKYFENTVAGFSRYHKYTLGSELRDLSRAVLLAVVRANRKDDRIAYLQLALGKLEELKVTIHLCTEVKAFNGLKSPGHSVKLVGDVARQCEGWLRSARIQPASSPLKNAESKSLGTRSTQRV